MLKFKGKLDILIMCHGIFKVGKLMDTSVQSFDNSLNINVRSNFHLISLVTPFLKLTKGNIVALSSVESKFTIRDSFLNCLSKKMLDSLIQNAALELAPFGVRVNAVAPGATFTNLRVTDVFTEEDNKEYLEKLSGIFLLNNEVRIILINRCSIQKI
jgi:NAD(P)-dependent dehydrogenase (short-subunit alcohol dehydrogenase family)